MVLILVLCGIVALFIPTHFTHAGVIDWLIAKPIEAIASLPALLLAFVLSILTWVAAALLGLSTLILDWAISNPFPVSLTVPGAVPANPIIQIGWTLTRDLVNMLFVLGLAYIGLATALNISNFETKKTFKNLILVAILINFTPVICGVIVDAANIISNFFLRSVSFGAIIDIFKQNQMQVLAEFKNPLQIAEKIPAILQSLSLIVFGIVGFFLFLLYSALFIIRAPIIWILVILSPLAFFASIFGQTKKYFKQWWDTFIQWTMVVVPAGFFLYLGMHALTASKDLLKAGSMGNSSYLGKLFTSIAPLFVVMLFLIIGFMMSMKINAAGSGAIVQGSKKWGMKGLKGTGTLAKRGGKGIRNKWAGREGAPPSPHDTKAYDAWKGTNRRTKISAATRTAGRYVFGGETEQEKEKWGKGGQKWARRAVRGVGAVAGGSTYLGRRAIRKGAAMIDESTSKEITEKAGKLEGKNLATVQAALDNAVTNSGRVAAIKAARKNNQIDHLNLSDDMKEKIIKDTLKSSPGEMYEVKNLDPYITAKVVRENPMSPKVTKTAGMLMKYEDKKKYGKVTGTETIIDGDDKLKSMTVAEKNTALIKDNKGNAKLNDDGQKQYKVNTYHETESKYGDDTDIVAAKIIAGIKAPQMNTLDENTALKIADTDVAHEFWEGAQVAKAAELFGTGFIAKFQGKVNELGEAFYEKNNKPLHKFLRSTGAQRVGLNFDEARGSTKATEAMNRLTRELKSLQDELATADDPSSNTRVADMQKIEIKITAKKKEIEKQEEKESKDQKKDDAKKTEEKGGKIEENQKKPKRKLIPSKPKPEDFKEG